MATVKSIPRRQRLASYRGRYMVDTVRGIIRVRKWPQKRGTPKSALQRWWNDWFTQANLLAKYADAASQRRAIELTSKTGLYPRDIILKAMRGRLYTWRDETGWKWYSVAAIQDISESLDVLAQTIGSVLVRATDRWRSPPAATIGDVLTYQGDTAPPEWSTPTGGGSWLGGALVGKTANQSIANATVVPLTFDTEAYDTHAIHDNVTDNDLLTVPTGFDLVQLQANCYLQPDAGGFRQLSIQKNGAGILGGGEERRYYDGSTAPFINVSSAPLIVTAGDEFRAIVYQNGGGSLLCYAAVNTFFSMTLLRQT